MGIFVDVGPLQCFVSTHVSIFLSPEKSLVPPLTFDCFSLDPVDPSRFHLRPERESSLLNFERRLREFPLHVQNFECLEFYAESAIFLFGVDS